MFMFLPTEYKNNICKVCLYDLSNPDHMGLCSTVCTIKWGVGKLSADLQTFFQNHPMFPLLPEHNDYVFEVVPMRKSDK